MQVGFKSFNYGKPNIFLDIKNQKEPKNHIKF